VEAIAVCNKPLYAVAIDSDRGAKGNRRGRCAEKYEYCVHKPFMII